jgi:hypothetical protein
LLIFCIAVATTAVEIRSDHPWTIIDFEVSVTLEFRRILAELLPNGVADRVLDIVDSLAIVADVLASKSFDVGNTTFQFGDRRFELCDRSKLPNLRWLRRLCRAAWHH